eukprot:6710071-Prymnesium_polylepis.2
MNKRCASRTPRSTASSPRTDDGAGRGDQDERVCREPIATTRLRRGGRIGHRAPAGMPSSAHKR